MIGLGGAIFAIAGFWFFMEKAGRRLIFLVRAGMRSNFQFDLDLHRNSHRNLLISWQDSALVSTVWASIMVICKLQLSRTLSQRRGEAKEECLGHGDDDAGREDGDVKFLRMIHQTSGICRHAEAIKPPESKSSPIRTQGSLSSRYPLYSHHQQLTPQLKFLIQFPRLTFVSAGVRHQAHCSRHLSCAAVQRAEKEKGSLASIASTALEDLMRNR